MQNATTTKGGSAIASSALLNLIATDDIVPGSDPSYDACKTIYAYHPLGKRLVDYPIELAQSQPRNIVMGGMMELEDMLLDQFNRVWKKENADYYIASVMSTARIYGAAALTYGVDGYPTDQPLPLSAIVGRPLYFNILDPLNTAGSLVLSQDPNSPNFQKPTYLVCNGIPYHASRSCIVFNEKPIYLEFTSSAFGFSGRSVYQRPFYLLKSFINSMLTNNWILEKSALLVHKQPSAGNPVTRGMQGFAELKRTQIKGARSGNVLQIGEKDELSSLDLHNLKEPTEYARRCIIQDIASSEDMPAQMVLQEPLAQGFGEGTEDAKMMARYVDRIRSNMAQVYDFVDPIIQRRAWDEDFYVSVQKKYPEIYAGVPYETAYYSWIDSFEATWPNLLIEPDSEKAKIEDITLKAAISAAEVLLADSDPINKANIKAWLAEVINEKKLLFKSTLEIDQNAVESYIPPSPAPFASTEE